MTYSKLVKQLALRTRWEEFIAKVKYRQAFAALHNLQCKVAYKNATNIFFADLSVQLRTGLRVARAFFEVDDVINPKKLS